MDQSEQTMIDNLKKNTGKSLEEWVEIVRASGLAKHGEIIKHLKEVHGFTHGYANLVAHKANASDAGSAADQDSLVTEQYKGKENLRPVYDRLVAELKKFGDDIELAPKKAYVSVRRKKQFAMLTPATKSRFELGINLKGQEAVGVLETITAANAMCSHKINLASTDDVNPEVVDWMKKAYEQAG